MRLLRLKLPFGVILKDLTNASGAAGLSMSGANMRYNISNSLSRKSISASKRPSASEQAIFRKQCRASRIRVSLEGSMTRSVAARANSIPRLPMQEFFRSDGCCQSISTIRRFPPSLRNGGGCLSIKGALRPISVIQRTVDGGPKAVLVPIDPPLISAMSRHRLRFRRTAFFCRNPRNPPRENSLRDCQNVANADCDAASR